MKGLDAATKAKPSQPNETGSQSEYRLGDIASVQQGYTFSPEYQGQSEGKWHYVKVGDLNAHGNSKYLDRTFNYVDDDVVAQIGATPFPAGSIVFPRVGAALKNNNKRILRHASLTDDNVIVVIVKDENTCNAEFLYYWFDAQDLQRFCNDGTVPVINGKNLKRELVRLPPLGTQKRTAELLSSWDRATQTTGQLIAAKERRYSHELSRLFSEGGTTPRKCPLGDISYVPQKLPAAPKADDVYVLVRLYCKGIEKNERQKKAPTKNGRPLFRRNAGELLVGRQNIHNGGFGVVPQGLDGSLASNAITSLSFHPDKACTEYVFFYLSRPSYYKKLERVMGGTGQKEISESQLLAISIPLPDIRTQTAIARYLNALREEIDLLGQSVTALKTQKRGLMQKLLTGQWRLPLTQGDDEHV